MSTILQGVWKEGDGKGEEGEVKEGRRKIQTGSYSNFRSKGLRQGGVRETENERALEKELLTLRVGAIATGRGGASVYAAGLEGKSGLVKMATSPTEQSLLRGSYSK